MKNHKIFKKKAVAMQSKEEKLMKGTLGSPFNSKAWNNKKEGIKKRVIKKIARFKIRKMEREEALKAGKPVVYSIK
jgi:hypothetical protein